MGAGYHARRVALVERFGLESPGFGDRPDVQRSANSLYIAFGREQPYRGEESSQEGTRQEDRGIVEIKVIENKNFKI